MPFYKKYKNGYILHIKLSPNSSFCGFRDVYVNESGDEYIKAFVTTVPEKGKANKELIKLLSKKLHFAKSLFQIIQGETDHLKKIFIEIEQNETNEDLLASLAEKVNKQI